MTEAPARPCTAFQGNRLLVSGPLCEVAVAAKEALDRGPREPILTFDDTTGRVIDLDLPASAPALAEPSIPVAPANAGHGRGRPATAPRRPGRPKLGVVAREVTLLPRHWQWLAAQQGGASAALRRLVDEARRNGGARQEARAAKERAYRFMTALAGDLPGFEEALRALFADDRSRFDQQVADWPGDVRAYATRLAFGPPSG